MTMKSSFVCALEPEKITKTKWAQLYGTPCIFCLPKIFIIIFLFKVDCHKKIEDLKLRLFAHSNIWHLVRCLHPWPGPAAGLWQGHSSYSGLQEKRKNILSETPCSISRNQKRAFWKLRNLVQTSCSSPKLLYYFLQQQWTLDFTHCCRQRHIRY